MATADDVLDEHLGMIDRGTAEKIAESKSVAEAFKTPQIVTDKPLSITVDQLISQKVRVESLVDIEEEVYRVYNKKQVNISGADIYIRIFVLGTQGENARVILFKEKADLANSIPIERGDRILASKFVVKRGYNGLELASIDHSTIERIRRSESGMVRFDAIDGASEVDVIGRITSIGQVKHSIFAISNDNDSCTFTMTDGFDDLKVTVLGNAVREISQAHPGEIAKVEFAQVRKGNGKTELYVNESSRILVSETLKDRLR